MPTSLLVSDDEDGCDEEENSADDLDAAVGEHRVLKGEVGVLHHAGVRRCLGRRCRHVEWARCGRSVQRGRRVVADGIQVVVANVVDLGQVLPQTVRHLWGIN